MSPLVHCTCRKALTCRQPSLRSRNSLRGWNERISYTGVKWESVSSLQMVERLTWGCMSHWGPVSTYLIPRHAFILRQRPLTALTCLLWLIKLKHVWGEKRNTPAFFRHKHRRGRGGGGGNAESMTSGVKSSWQIAFFSSEWLLSQRSILDGLFHR